MLCVIVAAGIIESYARHRALLSAAGHPDLVLCADGGLAHMARLGLAPDEILGDFDSADPTALDAYARRGAATQRFQRDKDYTDTELAVSHAISKGCGRILLLGALGGRADHSMANIQLSLKSLDMGARVVLADDLSLITAIRNETLQIERGRVLRSMLCNGRPARGEHPHAPKPNFAPARAAAPLPAPVHAFAPTPSHESELPASNSLAPVPVPAFTPAPAPKPALAPKPAPASALSPAPAHMATSPLPPGSEREPDPAISILPIGGPARSVRTSGLKYPILGLDLPASYTTGVSNEFLPGAMAATISVGSGALLVMACRADG